ncbi:MAG: hypothetical protein HYV29_06730 [Ignavibacteriales bacterium]|nr:hypothetical protein [Ignavibacteriales bacterium]
MKTKLFSTRTILFFASLFILCVTLSFSQPYLYFPKYSNEEQDEREIDIIRLNLQTDNSEIVVSNIGRVIQLFSNSDQSKLFIQGRGYLNVLELRDNFPQRTIIDGVEWIHDIRDVPQTNRIYISVGSDESYEKTVVLDRSTYDTLQIISEFMSFHRPFLSEDASKFFRFIPDSAGILFDIYNSSSGSRIAENKRCGDIGPFAFDAGFLEGKNGVGIVRVRFKKKDKLLTQQYAICSPEAGSTSGIIAFPLRSEAILSNDTKSVIIEEVQFINDNDPNTPPEYHTGNIYIFDAQTGKLLQKLNLPPEGKILLFDNYPDKLFYLTGTEGTFQSIQASLNTVMPVATLIDSLIALTNQCSLQKFLGDSNFVKELTNHLDNAKKHLAKQDSVNCSKEVEKFQDKVNKEYEKTVDNEKKNKPRDKRFVTVEGWKFLYYNAQYIIDRLPGKEKKK